LNFPLLNIWKSKDTNCWFSKKVTFANKITQTDLGSGSGGTYYLVYNNPCSWAKMAELSGEINCVSPTILWLSVWYAQDMHIKRSSWYVEQLLITSLDVKRHLQHDLSTAQFSRLLVSQLAMNQCFVIIFC
jgi:hypothetical protein